MNAFEFDLHGWLETSSNLPNSDYALRSKVSHNMYQPGSRRVLLRLYLELHYEHCRHDTFEDYRDYAYDVRQLR